MDKREVIRMVFEHQRPLYVPWSLTFTYEAAEKLRMLYQVSDLEPMLGNHLLELGNSIGFFTDLGNHRVRDHFGVVWNRSIDKDIGNVEGLVLPEPSLKDYSFPDPLEPRFFADIPTKLAE
jgi:uroporphyrinogen decarboxylase